MNFLMTLANAIKKRSLDIELTSVEKAVYEQAYCDCLGKNNEDFNRDSEVYNYYCSLFDKMISQRDMFSFKVFNAVLQNNNSAISLVDFCKFCGFDSADSTVRSKVIDSINNWFLEEEYCYDEDVCGNPLVIINSLKEIKIDNKLTLNNLRFAIITGVSVGGKCINEDGSLDMDKLYDSLINYINFKNQFLSDTEYLNLDGVVLMGDLFDIFSNVYALANTNKKKMSNLVRRLKAFGKQNSDSVSLNKSFLGIVSGHNDSWFGAEIKDACEVFGSHAMYLGKYGPCTTIKNDYSHFSKYLYTIYNDVLSGNRSKEGSLCYFVPNDVADNLKVENHKYEVTICDLVGDGIKMIDYNGHTITYSYDEIDSKIKLKNKVV